MTFKDTLPPFVASLFFLAACSAGAITPGTDTSSNGTTPSNGAQGGSQGDPQSGGASSASNGDGGGVSSDGGGAHEDAGSSAGSACPCPKNYYCDLATNACVAGCLDETQCPDGWTCDTNKRTCSAPPMPKLAGCPIPPGTPGVDGGAAATCSGVTPLGTDVAQTCKTGALPAAKGGVVKDGVYVLAATEYYSSACTTGSYSATIYVCAGTWATYAGAIGAAGSDGTATATYANNGVTLTPTCPAGGAAGTTPYDATDYTLTIYTADGSGGGWADHYTRQ
jgi:hypothetical protein